MIELGYQVEDVITGFCGVATGRAQYISGCSQILVAPSLSADGAFREPQWLDEQRLKPTSKVVAFKLDNGQTPGPDREAPKR